MLRIAAAALGEEALVKQLLEAKAQVDLGNENGATPLIAGAFAGRVEVLLAAGPQLELKTRAGLTALQAAVEGEGMAGSRDV